MANIQEMKAQKAEKTLRLVTVLLLVVGILTFAAAMYDMVTGSQLLTLFDAQTEETLDTNHGGQTVAYVMLLAASALVVIGAIMIGCIYTGMNFLRIGSYYQQLAKGLIIIGAIMLDMAVSKKNR